jgi:hypothetical protein
MPFGVKNGPPTYQRVVTKAFHEYTDVFMKIFLNDFIVFSDLSAHLQITEGGSDIAVGACYNYFDVTSHYYQQVFF